MRRGRKRSEVPAVRAAALADRQQRDAMLARARAERPPVEAQWGDGVSVDFLWPVHVICRRHGLHVAYVMQHSADPADLWFNRDVALASRKWIEWTCETGTHGGQLSAARLVAESASARRAGVVLTIRV